jgi:hypothetical protein
MIEDVDDLLMGLAFDAAQPVLEGIPGYSDEQSDSAPAEADSDHEQNIADDQDDDDSFDDQDALFDSSPSPTPAAPVEFAGTIGICAAPTCGLYLSPLVLLPVEVNVAVPLASAIISANDTEAELQMHVIPEPISVESTLERQADLDEQHEFRSVPYHAFPGVPERAVESFVEFQDLFGTALNMRAMSENQLSILQAAFAPLESRLAAERSRLAEGEPHSYGSHRAYDDRDDDHFNDHHHSHESSMDHSLGSQSAQNMNEEDLSYTEALRRLSETYNAQPDTESQSIEELLAAQQQQQQLHQQQQHDHDHFTGDHVGNHDIHSQSHQHQEEPPVLPTPPQTSYQYDSPAHSHHDAQPIDSAHLSTSTPAPPTPAPSPAASKQRPNADESLPSFEQPKSKSKAPKSKAPKSKAAKTSPKSGSPKVTNAASKSAPSLPKSAKQPLPKQPATKTPKQAAPKQATPKQLFPKQGAPKQNVPKQAAPKQTPQPPTPKQPAPKQPAPKQPAPKQPAPKQQVGKIPSMGVPKSVPTAAAPKATPPPKQAAVDEPAEPNQTEEEEETDEDDDADADADDDDDEVVQYKPKGQAPKMGSRAQQRAPPRQTMPKSRPPMPKSAYKGRGPPPPKNRGPRKR